LVRDEPDWNATLFGLIKSCQFFWIISQFLVLPPSNRGKSVGNSGGWMPAAKVK
jgi:hypothetical protein